MYKGTDLLTLSSSGDSKKFTLRAFFTLFTMEEMAGGIVGPSRAKNGKTVLDTESVDLLKSE